MRPRSLIALGGLCLGCGTNETAPAKAGGGAAQGDGGAHPLATLPACGTPAKSAFDESSWPYPKAGSNAYGVPSPALLAVFGQAIDALVASDAPGAEKFADKAGYALCRDGDVALLGPKEPATGGAVVAWRSGKARALLLEAPHPVFDSGTASQAYGLFVGTSARALIAAGTHRCANTSPSECSGTTTACAGGASAKFRESDMAHVIDSTYHVAHLRLTNGYPSDLVIGVHGMAESGVSLSDGTELPTSESAPVARFRERLASELGAAGLSAETVTTCNAYPGAPHVEARLCGETDVQGRHLNGSTTPCTSGATAASGRFIHMEQSLAVRKQASAVAAAVALLVPAP